MTNLFPFLLHSDRSKKKRSSGLTSIIDKGLGLAWLNDIFSLSGEYIDIVKFGFGTGCIVPYEIIQKKIQMIKQYQCQVCFGGTLFEIIEKNEKFNGFLNQCTELGINTIEVSDGALPISFQRKLDCIKCAADKGFTVISEVGHKMPEIDKNISIEKRVDMISQELEAGSWKVIIEGRESGTVGLFDQIGEINEDDFSMLINRFDQDKLIFEAPLKQQQIWFINTLGCNVNLGNINPTDVISLEALRQQLRADTL